MSVKLLNKDKPETFCCSKISFNDWVFTINQIYESYRIGKTNIRVPSYYFGWFLCYNLIHVITECCTMFAHNSETRRGTHHSHFEEQTLHN